MLQRATKLKDFLVNSPASKDTAVVYLSTIIASGFGFISSLIIARNLPTASFGFFTAYSAIVTTAIGLTDLGLGTGLIRFVTPLLKTDKARARSFLKVVLYAEIAAGLLVLLPGLIWTKQIIALIGHDTPEVIVRLAIFSAAISSTGAYVGAVLNTYKKFRLNALLLIGISFFRLIFLIALLKMGSLSILAILAGYTLASLLGLLAGFAVIPKDYKGNVSAQDLKTAGKRILGFSGWLTFAYILNSIASRLDFFYLYRLKGPAEAGVYAAAIQLTIVFALLLGAVTTVMTPYISEKIALRDKKRFLKKSLVLAALGSICLLLSTLAFPFLINWLFGAKYVGAIPALKVLVVHFALNLLLLPVTLMFIPLGKVKVGTFISAGQLALSVWLYPIFITRFGSVGAALTILSSSVFALVMYPLMLSYFLHKEAQLEQLS